MKSHGLATYCRSSSFSASAQTCSRFGMCWRPICHFSQTTVISLWLRRLCRFLFILVIIFIQLHCILVTILFRYFLLFQLKCYLNEGTKHSMVFFSWWNVSLNAKESPAIEVRRLPGRQPHAQRITFKWVLFVTWMDRMHRYAAR